jgi:hypothetical protein
MSDLILFSLNAIVVYLLADWILRLVERKRGAVIKQRQIVFFVIFLALALLSFSLLRNLPASPIPGWNLISAQTYNPPSQALHYHPTPFFLNQSRHKD